MNYFKVILFVFLISSCLEANEVSNADCSVIDKVSNLRIKIVNFSHKECEDILFKEMKNGVAIDSFSVGVKQGNSDEDGMSYTIKIDKNLNLKSTYIIDIINYPPFVLSDMKMIAEPCMSMTKKAYCCNIGYYKLNGEEFYNSEPRLGKIYNYKYSK